MLQPLVWSRSVALAVSLWQSPPRWLQFVFWTILSVAIFLANLVLPDHIATTELDPSWEQTVHYGYLTGMQWGVDLVATRGPLGLFDTREYHPQTYHLLLIWYALTSAGLAGLALVFLWQPDVAGMVRCSFVGLLLVAPLFPGYDEMRPMILLYGGALLLLHSTAPPWPGLLLMAGYVGVLAMVKVTYLAAGSLVLGLLLFHVARVRGVRLAALLLAVALLSCQLGWFAAGQKLTTWLPFLKNSLLVVGAYNQALHLEFSQAALLGGLLSLTFLMAGSATAFWHWPAGSARIAAWICIGAAGFQSFKLGFGRYDEFHWNRAFLIWSSLALLVWQLAPAARSLRWSFGPLLALTALTVVPATQSQRWEIPNRLLARVTTNAETLVHAGVWHSQREEERADLRARHGLPRIVATVGSAPVDLFTFQQGVLFLNDLNYRPRPIRQSHMAYSPALAELNRQHLIGPRGPEYVLSRWETIDERLPTMDDGSVLLELLHRYQPLFEENQVLLLRRRPEPIAPLRQVRTKEVVIPFDEPTAVPVDETCCQAFTVEFATTRIGAMRSRLIQGPHVFMEVEFTDGCKQRYRIIPGMMRQPILLSPLPDTADRMARFIQTGTCDRIPRSLCFSTCQPNCLEPNVRVTFISLPDLKKHSTESPGTHP